MLYTLMQLLHYILKYNHFWMTIVRVFVSKLLASLMRNYFPKRPSDAPLHALSKLYDIHIGFFSLLSFETVYCFICSRRRLADARYRMICLFHLNMAADPMIIFFTHGWSKKKSSFESATEVVVSTSIGW